MSSKPGLAIGDISELLQQLGVIVWESFGGKWFVRYVSRHTQNALGLAQDQWNPDLTAWIGLLHDEDRATVRDLILKAMNSGDAVVFDDRVRRADGD